jgi:hypothetical protein
MVVVMRLAWIGVVFSALVLVGCATPYGSQGITGGFTELELEPNIWRINYGGNGFTTAETVQTYWLYRCAEITLEKGFAGFEVISNTHLVQGTAREVRVAGPVYVPMYIPMDSGPKPELIGDIRLLKAPVATKPGKVFDATWLKAQLEPFVKGKKCDEGNVCPHVHHYLYPPRR